MEKPAFIKLKRVWKRMCIVFFLTISYSLTTIYAATRPVDLVYPLLDSENSRWIFFSSASRPFGMVNLSPDTRINGDWGSGYRYEVDTIRGFSHIHEWQLSGLLVMPVTVTPENRISLFKDFSSKFSHATELVKPGYHSVILDRYSVKAELTSTPRVGLGRYHFPKKSDPAMMIYLNGELGPCINKGGTLQKTGPRTLKGSLTNEATRRRPKDFKLFFQIDFNADIKNIEKDGKTGNYLISFDLPADKQILMKSAISYTSEENAGVNLKNELPHWDFDSVVKESQEEWNNMLSRILIEGGTKEQQRRFYTDLYHSILGRRSISDSNGAYPDYTGKTFQVKQLPCDKAGKPLFNQYNSDAFWGAQWTLNTLWDLVYPEIAEEFVHSMMQYYHDGGMIPRGPSGGNYTFVMTGASTTPFIVSAFQKGIIRENTEEIYQALKKNHMPGGIMERAGYEHNTSVGGGLKYYMEKGYVPYPLPEKSNGFHLGGAGMTLEYAYQDWTLAQMARALGHNDDYAYFIKRSQNYRNLYDPETGWIRPKDVNGKWLTPFDPYQYTKGFIESNGAQATWFVPQDLPGLADLMGGKDAAIQKLVQSFQTAQKLGFTSGNSHDKEVHPEYSRIPINYGNEPSIQTAFIFSVLGKPDLTQYWSREVVNNAFSGLAPSKGYNGDEDQGLMGTLAVLYKIGLFQMNGGTEANPQYQLGSPIFDKITIQLNQKYYPGKSLTIQTIGNSDKNRYILSADLNGEKVNDPWINHDVLVQGGVLTLKMGSGTK
jgi:predicted alpha-1,2-mannosidase